MTARKEKNRSTFRGKTDAAGWLAGEIILGFLATALAGPLAILVFLRIMISGIGKGHAEGDESGL